MTSTEWPRERIAFLTLTASLGIVQFNLLAAQVLFGVAALLWVSLVANERQMRMPPFFPPLVAYAAVTLVSALFSFNRLVSLIDCKQFVLFLMVPMVFRLARGNRAMTVLNVVIAMGAAGAVLGVVEATMLGFDNLDHRPMGTLSHYMTYSGLIMLVLCATVARVLFYPAQRIWPAIAIPALAAALTLTLTKNAWIGALAGIACLLTLRRARLLIAVPVAAVLAILFAVAAPAAVRDRAITAFDLRQDSNRERVQMIQMGGHIVRDHPWFGVGPDQIESVYPQYRPPDAVHPTNPHLHNVPVQIAAERGLPALAVWLWFIGVALWSLWRHFASDRAPALSAAGVAAIVSMLAAGLFEYNFGDSEFLMLFLGLITLPFAATEDAGAEQSSR